MPFYYYISIPQLPPEISHQSGSAEHIHYLTMEGEEVRPGTPIALLPNWWAMFQVEAVGSGYLTKCFFQPGATIRIGDPIGIITTDGETVPNGATLSVRIQETRNLRPVR